MKRLILVALLMAAVFVLNSCGSTKSSATATGNETRQPTAPISSGSMSLDEAIAQAAAQMEARLPVRTEVALISVSSPSTPFSQYVLDGIEAALVGSGKLVVVDRANLDKVRAEQGFQESGEVSDDSAKSIGRMVGAGAIVTGSLTNIGALYRLTLKAIDVEKAVVAVSFPADITNDERVRALLGQSSIAAVPRSTASPTATTGSGTVQAPAPAPQPQLQISENDLIGVWKGRYFAGQGETGLTLSVYKEGGKYMAIFDFYNLPGRSNSGEGKYYMDVSYNRAREKFYLKGVTWIEQPSGYGFADLEGTITGDIFSGTVNVIGANYTFRVVRQ